VRTSRHALAKFWSISCLSVRAGGGLTDAVTSSLQRDDLERIAISALVISKVVFRRGLSAARGPRGAGPSVHPLVCRI
jgi:hypothetical protein